MGATQEKMSGHRIYTPGSQAPGMLPRRPRGRALASAAVRYRPAPPPAAIAKGAKASTGQVLDFDLLLGGEAPDLVELMDGGGIVHAAQGAMTSSLAW